MQSSKWANVREEKKREKTHRSGIGVWVDVGPSMECRVELRLSVVGAWGGAEGFRSGCFLLELELEGL